MDRYPRPRNVIMGVSERGLEVEEAFIHQRIEEAQLTIDILKNRLAEIQALRENKQ